MGPDSLSLFFNLQLWVGLRRWRFQYYKQSTRKSKKIDLSPKADNEYLVNMDYAYYEVTVKAYINRGFL